MNPLPPASPERRLSQHLLCFASAFTWTKADLRRWRKTMDELPAPDKEGEGRFLVDQYVPAFRDVVFFDDPQGEKSAKRFRTRWAPQAFASLRRPRKDTPVPVTGRVVAGELYAFPSGLGIFVVEVDLGPGTTLAALSTAGDTLRSFEADLVWQDGRREPFAQFIRDRVLSGVEIRGDTVDIDEYSGSKLKTFVVGDLGEGAPRDLQRVLLYDLGCFVPVGSAGGALRFSPTPEYLQETLGNAVSVFDEWSALGLADAFVAVGTGLLGGGPGTDPWKTWRETYLRLFVFNLHVKFAAQRLAAGLDQSVAVAARDENAHFLVAANLPRVSYNFLPNLLHQAMRRGLEVEEDLENLRARVKTLSRLLDEGRQKRQNTLLTVVSVFSGVQTYRGLVSQASGLQASWHMNPALFWGLAVLMAGGVAAALGTFLFPEQVKSLRRGLRKWWRRRARQRAAR
jgi:hypothetical protein